MTQAATQPSTKLPFAIAPEVAAKAPDKLTLADTPAMIEYRELKRVHDSRGWPRTMMIFAVICAVCFLITFLTTRERLAPIEKQKSSILKDIKILVTIGPWIVMFLVTITHYVLSGIRGSAYNYYVNYLLDQQAMTSFLQQWRLPTINPDVDPSNLSLWYKFLFYSKLVIYENGSNVPAVVYGLLQMTNKLWNVVGIVAASYLVVQVQQETRRVDQPDRQHGFHSGAVLGAASTTFGACSRWSGSGNWRTPPRCRSCGCCSPTFAITPNGKPGAALRVSFTRRSFLG